MMWGITGSPGTGKTSVADELAARGHPVVHLSDTVEKYVIERDPIRDTLVVDVERWAAEFTTRDGFVEGHLAHYLPCDRIIILRCRPDVLQSRLNSRAYEIMKVRENIEAEALDVILIETLEQHPVENVFELDTTSLTIQEITERIEEFIEGKLPPRHGTIDWSEYLVQEI